MPITKESIATFQMRLYTMHKGQHLLILIMFLCLFFIALLMGMAGPSIITEHAESASKLTNGSDKIPGGPFVVLTPKLSTYRQQMWVSAKLIIKEKGEVSFTKQCVVRLRVEGIAQGGRKVLVGGMEHNRTRSVICKSDDCDAFIIMHLGVLEFPRYVVNITLFDLESIDKKFNIADIVFTVVTYNPDFTRMEIWFRFFFVGCTVVVALIFYVGGMKNFGKLI